MLVAGRAQSFHTGRVRERHGDDWPFLICLASVYTWTWLSLVETAVVWVVGPYCWLGGSDFRTPGHSRHPQTEGNVSLTQHFSDTCRVCQVLDAESQARAPPPSSPLPPLPPTVPNSPCLLPSFSLPLSLHPHSLPSPPPTPTFHLPTFPPFHSPVSRSPSLCCPWHREGVLLGGLLEGRDQKSEEPDPEHLCGARGFCLVSMECSLCGTLSVTAMQGLLEASSRMFLFGGAAQLPKDPALGFVPRIVGRHPVGILSSSHT